jgi:hypothetical protein
MNEPSADKRIIIDEDWKTQVERERDQLRQNMDPESVRRAEAESGADQLPPASFPFLVTSLVTQILAALGQFPDAMNQQHSVSLPLARFNIDLLEVVQQKTRGNLTPDEETMLEDALYQVRMLYVAVRDSLEQQVTTAAAHDLRPGQR